MLTIDTLRDEHNGVLTVLDSLERAVAAIETGAAVPVSIFSDIREFFAVFVDRCHHGKEEGILFPALGSVAWALQARIADEHNDGRELARAYAEAVQWYVPRDREAAARLANAARRYGAFLRRHIALETEELFPAIAQTLTPERDAAIVNEFERFEVEQIGAGTHERLHGMIASLASRIAGVAVS